MQQFENETDEISTTAWVPPTVPAPAWARGEPGKNTDGPMVHPRLSDDDPVPAPKTKPIEPEIKESVNASDHSPQVAAHFAHFAALRPISTLSVGKSIAIQKAGLNGAYLAKIALSLSKGEKRFLIVEHEGVFEAARMPDGYPLELLQEVEYATVKKELDIFAEMKEAVKDAIVKLHTMDPENALKYCVGIPQTVLMANLVPLAYLQRRLANISHFRKFPGGPTKAIHEILSRLQADGYLVPVPKKQTQEDHGTSAKCFKVLTK